MHTYLQIIPSDKERTRIELLVAVSPQIPIKPIEEFVEEGKASEPTTQLVSMHVCVTDRYAYVPHKSYHACTCIPVAPCIPTYTYVHTYIQTYIHTYIHTLQWQELLWKYFPQNL